MPLPHAAMRTSPRLHRSADNRRTQPRVEMELDVDVTTGDASFTGFSGNVSTGGIYVAWHGFAGRTPRINERLNVSFSLPGIKEPIAATAEVRWSRSGTPGGIGAQFLDLPPRSRRLLEHFVALREPLG